MRAGPGGLRAPTSTELRRVNVPFSHPSELYLQKDGRKVRSCWEGTFTFRRVLGGRRCVRDAAPPRASLVLIAPFRRDRSSSAPRSVGLRVEIGRAPRRDRFEAPVRCPPGVAAPQKVIIPRTFNVPAARPAPPNRGITPILAAPAAADRLKSAWDDHFSHPGPVEGDSQTPARPRGPHSSRNRTDLDEEEPQGPVEKDPTRPPPPESSI